MFRGRTPRLRASQCTCALYCTCNAIVCSSCPILCRADWNGLVLSLLEYVMMWFMLLERESGTVALLSHLAVWFVLRRTFGVHVLMRMLYFVNVTDIR